jgi:hypothetical protein
MPDEAVALTEARTGRLFPGDGRLPLHDLVHALPTGVALSVEAPVSTLADVPAAERVRRAHVALTRLLEETEPGAGEGD